MNKEKIRIYYWKKVNGNPNKKKKPGFLEKGEEAAWFFYLGYADSFYLGYADSDLSFFLFS